MAKPNEQKMFIMIGIYVIVILALMRFMVYPLRAALEEKKTIFTDLSDTYQLKAQQYERQNLDRRKASQVGTVSEQDVTPYLYDKAMPLSSVQVEILENIMSAAEKKGLTVQNFEMMEPAIGKKVSEVPVMIRLSGAKAKDLFDLLKALSSEKKALRIRSMEMNRTDREILLTLTLNGFRME